MSSAPLNSAPLNPEPATLRVLLVDDEAPARDRLRELLADLGPALPCTVVGEAEHGLAALLRLQEQPADVVLADIRMPRMDGLELASHLGQLPQVPALIFVTAYDHYAVQAFELNAVDYLLKPVRLSRLHAALDKARQRLGTPLPPALGEIGREWRGSGRSHLPTSERQRLLLLPVADILYFRADLKYVVARTAEQEYLLDEALTHLEQEYPERFLRLHRAVLVARDALAGSEKAGEDDEVYAWAILKSLPEKLPVSRRQWPALKALLKQGG
ncbi:MAG: hypothetical protein RIR00_1676 [Pseudomonadota bacterium]|jgi:two-component system response regulator AlgR